MEEEEEVILRFVLAASRLGCRGLGGMVFFLSVGSGGRGGVEG